MKTSIQLLIAAAIICFGNITAQTPWYLSTGNSIGSNDYLGSSSGTEPLRFVVNGTERMRIDGSSTSTLIGIGVTTPLKTLHVKGEAQFDLSSSGNGGRIVLNRPDATSYESLISFNTNGNYKWLLGMDNDNTEHLRIFGSSGQILVLGTNGNLGIGFTGTVAPGNRLHVNGNAMFANNNVLSANSSPMIIGTNEWSSETAPDFTWAGDQSSGIFHPESKNIALSTNGHEVIRITEDWKVGIGTSNPCVSLQLSGDMALGSTVTGERWFFHTRDWANGDVFHLAHDDDNGNWIYDLSVQRSTGNIGIGANTNDPGFANYRLSVNGKIRAKEIKVETGWSDYVFLKDYDLKTLNEVEKFISENGHLPGIPSAAEVEKNGIELGQMESKLLEKIEELTLYIIEQEKRMEQLSAEIKKLKK
jgi:hypothetical protein